MVASITRKISMTTTRRMMSQQSGRIRALTSQPSFDDAGPKDGSKRKRTKQPKEQAHPSSTATTSGTPEGGPLGKKRLRKMRYQQRLLSETDFALYSVHVLDWTRSVRPVDSADPPSSVDPSPYKAPSSKVCIRTTTEPLPLNPPDSSTPHPNRTEDDAASPTTPSIRIQPLLVLDLNGILCHRIPTEREPDRDEVCYRPSIARIAGTPVIPRTDVFDFMNYLDQHFCLAIWTSAQSKTAMKLIEQLIPEEVANRLLFVWSQHHCRRIVTDKGQEPRFEKDLAKVWKDYPLWNPYNTLLVDDSPEKCEAWEANAIHPVALNGRVPDTTEVDNGQPPRWPDDAETEQRQRLFFEHLVEHWSKHPLVQTLKSARGETQTTSATSRTQASFLEDHLDVLTGET